jgi:hypothetical protein
MPKLILLAALLILAACTALQPTATPPYGGYEILSPTVVWLGTPPPSALPTITPTVTPTPTITVTPTPRAAAGQQV